MKKNEQIIVGIGTFLLIIILIYPPVNLDGFSPTFKFQYELNRQLNVSSGDILLVVGDHGKSGSNKINWNDSRRRLFFQKNSFDEDISIKRVPSNLSKNNPAKEFDGIIKWESEINTGRLFIELLLISIITAGSIFFMRNKNN